MDQSPKWLRAVLRVASYVLVAMAASFVAFAISGAKEDPGLQKIGELYSLIDSRFIGEVDAETLYDMAAEGMVAGTGDRWSYYISAQEYAEYEEHQNNTYVGVGITIVSREDGKGFEIVQVEPGGSAQEQGILPGDILMEADGIDLTQMDINDVSSVVGGKENTQVQVKVLRGDQTLTFTLTRKSIEVQVATGQMLDGGIGYIRISNFNSNCARDTKEQIQLLVEQGATALIFDVRYNGGGYKNEMVKLLDYILPEGDLFRSVDYRGKEEVDTSDAACLNMPMAVLVNGSSYSAAEFFAAALEEYDWAVVVGTPTSGKGYFQSTYRLQDGSAVALSIGKYFTPKGVSLAEVGGLVPLVQVEVDNETAAQIYSQTLDPAEDPQVQAAIEALKG